MEEESGEPGVLRPVQQQPVVQGHLKERDYPDGQDLRALLQEQQGRDRPHFQDAVRVQSEDVQRLPVPPEVLPVLHPPELLAGSKEEAL